MLKKGRELISLPVIEQKSGQPIGEIKDIYYDPRLKNVNGFIVEEKSWFKGAKLIDIQDVEVISDKAIYIENADVIVDTNESTEYNTAFNQRVDIRGYKMVNDNGHELGVIRDLLIETDKNCIYGYEISDGVINDLLSGRTSVKVEGNIAIENNLVMISGH